MKKGLPRPITLNQSSLKSYLNCQRLYGWQKIQRLSPVGRRSALEIGTSVHLGLSIYHGGGINYKQLIEEPPPDASEQDHVDYEESKDELIEAAKLPLVEQAIFIARWKLTQRAGPTSSFQDKDLGEALDIVNRVLPAYVEYWKGQGEIWHPLNQEIEACVEVGDDTNVFLRFRADNLSSAKGGLYLVDYKTAGRMDPRDLLKYEMDIQLSAYIYGLTKQLTIESLAKGGDPVFIRGAIIDVLVKTAIPQFAREMYSRTIEELQEFEAQWVEYGNRIREQEDRVRGCCGHDESVHETEEYRGGKSRSCLVPGCTCTAFRAAENWKIVFPQNTEHCFRFGTCAFRDVCLKDTPIRRRLYDQRTDDYVDTAQRELHITWLRVEGRESEIPVPEETPS